MTGQNTAGTDLDAIHQTVAGEIAAITAKATPVAGDYLLLEDSAASNAKKSVTIGDIITDWATWAPSYTNITVGNGTVVARYTQIRKTIVAYYQLNFGTTTSIDGANPTITLPVTRSSQYTASRMFWTDVYLRCAGTQYVGLIRSPATTTVGPFYQTTSGGNVVLGVVNATTPGTWTTDDQIAWHITYEAA